MALEQRYSMTVFMTVFMTFHDHLHVRPFGPFEQLEKSTKPKEMETLLKCVEKLLGDKVKNPLAFINEIRKLSLAIAKNAKDARNFVAGGARALTVTNSMDDLSIAGTRSLATGADEVTFSVSTGVSTSAKVLGESSI